MMVDTLKDVSMNLAIRLSKIGSVCVIDMPKSIRTSFQEVAVKLKVLDHPCAIGLQATSPHKFSG